MAVTKSAEAPPTSVTHIRSPPRPRPSSSSIVLIDTVVLKTRGRGREGGRRWVRTFSFLPLPNEPPLLLHQLDVSRREARWDVEFSVVHPAIDLQLGGRAAIDEDVKKCSALIHAEGIERELPVIVQLEQNTNCSVRGRHRIKRRNIAFRDCRNLFDRDLFTCSWRAKLRGKNCSVVRIPFHVRSESAARLFCFRSL